MLDKDEKFINPILVWSYFSNSYIIKDFTNSFSRLKSSLPMFTEPPIIITISAIIFDVITSYFEQLYLRILIA